MTRKAVIWSVGTGLLGSMIFSWMLEPAVTFIMTRANNWTSGFTSSLQNDVYSNAALGTRDWLSVAIFQLLSSAWVGVYLGLVTSRIIRRFIFNSETARAANIRRTLAKIRGWLLVVMFLLVLYPTYVCSKLAFVSHADLQLNASFNQRFTVLAPALTEQEEEVIKSKWALMSNRKDYDAINASMDSLAGRLDKPLPKPLY